MADLHHNFHKTQQALRDHEAGHVEHLLLWQAVRHWLVRHKANLVSDLPPLLLDRLKGGDFPEQSYDYVIVDEFQDLTKGEQELMFRLRRPGGQLVALGDPRQSIYKFRGNDPQGLANLEELVGDGGSVTDVAITECQRCPKPIVVAANRLMALSGVEEMVPVSDAAANIHVVTWKTPEAEAEGMAAAIVENIHAHPDERHLAMVTRRQFGYWLRDKMADLDPSYESNSVSPKGCWSRGRRGSRSCCSAFSSILIRRRGGPGSGTRTRSPAKTSKRRAGALAPT